MYKSTTMDNDGLSNSESTDGGFLGSGLEPVRRTTTIHGVRVRLTNDLEREEIVFLVCAFISIIGAAVLTLVRIGDFETTSSDFVFSILLLVNLGFVAFYVVNGIFMERPYEVLVSLLAVLVVMLYCIVDYAVYKKKRTDLKLGRLIAICILGSIDIIVGILAVRRYFEGPTGIMQKIVGGNIQLQSVCRFYFVFSAFVKFDFQVVISLLVFLVTDGTLDERDKLVIGIGVPYSFFWLIIGLLAARYEKRILSFVFLGLFWAEPAYIIYLFLQTGKNLHNNEGISGTSSEVLVSRDAAIIAAGVVGLVVRFGLVLIMIKVTANFKKGLKERRVMETGGTLAGRLPVELDHFLQEHEDDFIDG